MKKLLKDIYIIRNTINNKIYVGQSNNVQDRFSKHLSEARLCTDNMPIHEAMREFGFDKFYYEIVELDVSNPDEREKYWIELLNSRSPNGYNVCIGGSGFGSGVDNPIAKLDQNTLNSLINDLMFSGMSNARLAMKYNCGEWTVWAVNNGKAYYNPELKYPLKKSNKYTSELIKQIKYSLKYEYDKSLSDIAQEYNVDLSQVSAINQGYIHTYSNEVYPLRSGNVKNWLSEDTISAIINDLYNSTMQQNDIAKKYNVSKSVISNINNGKTYYNPLLHYPIRDNDVLQNTKTIPISLVKEIENDLIQNYKSIHSISEEYNIPINQIFNINNGSINRYRDPNKRYPLRAMK